MKLTINQLKQMARALREQSNMSHSASLEVVAKQFGFKNWNVLHAKASGNKEAWQVGAAVRGKYLGHDFQGKLLAVRAYGDDKHHAVTVKFDRPVEVAKLGDQIATRVRVSAVIDENGITAEKISSGQPHMMVGLV